MKKTTGSIAGLSALFLVAGMVAAAPAFAAPTCTIAGDGVTLNVTVDSVGTKIKRLESTDPLLDDTIVVSSGNDVDVCPPGSGNEHTVFDINSINVSGTGPLTIDLTGGAFAPGFSTEDGLDEIEFYLASTVVLTIQGTTAVDEWTFGAGEGADPRGVGLNSDDDADIVGGTAAAPVTLAVALTANGGASNDTFEQLTKATETLRGGDGTDTVDYSSRTSALSVTVGTGANDGEQIPANAAENDDVGADIETVIGGSGADDLSVVPATSVLKYKLDGGPGIDEVSGADGRDTLLGGADNDILNGGGGRDTLNGGLGADEENGDAGNDTFDQENAANGGDELNGGADTDAVRYNLRSIGVDVTIGAGADDDGCTSCQEGDDVGVDIESVFGSKAADTLTAKDGSKVRFSAGAGNDTLIGADTVTGTDGNDRLLGGAGNDTIEGGTGNDYLSGDADADTLTGGAGADTLLGGGGNDRMNGEAGTDRLSGSSGDDELWGDGTNPAVKDTLVGGSNSDLCQRDLKDVLSGCEGRATGAAPTS